MTLKPHVTTPDLAERMASWLFTRNGIAIWQSVDPSRPEIMTTPVLDQDGTPTAKPAWWVGNTPACVITDIADVLVANDVVVQRFRVAVQQGEGMKTVCTGGATRRIRAAVAKAGIGAFYTFDHETREAVILRTESVVPLLDWLAPTTATP